MPVGAGSLSAMNESIAKIIDRCVAIETEYDNLENISLSPEDYEDASDRYQAKLELRWHKDELIAEYSRLNKSLGYTKRELDNISSRRTGM